MQFAMSPGSGFSIGSQADLTRYAAAVAAAGFDAVSLGLAQLEAFADQRNGGLSQARTILADSGLRCTDFMSLGVRRQARDELAQAVRLFDAAAAIGADAVTVICFTEPTSEVLDRLGAVSRLARAAGCRIGLEFCPGLVIDSIPTALALLDAIEDPSAGLTLDSWHFFRGSSTWADLEEVSFDRVAVVQFDDGRPSLSEDVMHETNHRRAWPGEGEFDLTRFAGALTQRGWDGVLSVEVLSDEARELEVEEYARRAYQSSRPYWS
jgi:sugar phosphate isomerase/epimerase